MINAQIRMVMIEKRQRPLLTSSYLSEDREFVRDDNIMLREHNFEDIIKMLDLTIEMRKSQGETEIFFNTLYIDKTIIKILQENGFEICVNEDINKVFVNLKNIKK